MPDATDSFDIVPADPADRPRLLSLMRAFYAGEGLAWDETTVTGCLGRMWDDPRHGRTWLATSAGEAVGYGIVTFGFSLEYGGVDALVDELYVRPDWRGRGIGTALLAAIEAGCRDSRISALHLEVDHDNLDGQRLYRRRGFVDHDRYLMTKRLDASPRIRPSGS